MAEYTLVRSADSCLLLFPEISYDNRDYMQALGKMLHDPLSASMVPLLWHGTEGYQRFIEASGFAEQQNILSLLWAALTRYKRDLSELEKYRDAETTEGLVKPDKLEVAITELQRKLPLMEEADMRLRVAMLRFLETHGKVFGRAGGGTSAQPVTIELKLSEMSIVSMPARETETKIERDKAGNIVTTTQTEKDVVSFNGGVA